MILIRSLSPYTRLWRSNRTFAKSSAYSCSGFVWSSCLLFRLLYCNLDVKLWLNMKPRLRLLIQRIRAFSEVNRSSALPLLCHSRQRYLSPGTHTSWLSNREASYTPTFQWWPPQANLSDC